MIYVATKIYSSPVVKKVMKKSLMGNYFDETMLYYMGMLYPSITDVHHSIEYVYKAQNYILVCDGEEEYKKSLSYINETRFEDTQGGVIAAFEKDGNVYKNITNLVKKYQGPEKNFYVNTDFTVKKHYITDNVLYIVDDMFNVYKFVDCDTNISLAHDKKNNILKLFDFI